MGMMLRDLDGMSLAEFGETIEAWNAAHDETTVKTLSDAEADGLAQLIDTMEGEG